MTEVHEKCAIVLGAAGGIGTSVVADFRGRGVRVAALDIEPCPSDRADSGVLYLRGDATDEDYLRDAIEEVAEKFGRLDYAVNMVGRVGQGDALTARTAAITPARSQRRPYDVQRQSVNSNSGAAAACRHR